MDNFVKDNGNFKLLLAHYPEYFLEDAPENMTLFNYEMDLVLSGHVHGGQIRLPFIGGIYANEQGLFPTLCDGLHEYDNVKLIISRGLGNSHFLPRFDNRPELVVVDINWY